MDFGNSFSDMFIYNIGNVYNIAKFYLPQHEDEGHA